MEYDQLCQLGSDNIFPRLVTASFPLFQLMANLTLAEGEMNAIAIYLHTKGECNLWTQLDVTWTGEGQLLHGDKGCYPTGSGLIGIRKSELVCIRLVEFTSLKISHR